MTADDLAIQNATNLHKLVGDVLATTKPLDPHTLAVAEKTVRDMIPAHSAAEVWLLDFAADAIHNLGVTS